MRIQGEAESGPLRSPHYCFKIFSTDSYLQTNNLHRNSPLSLVVQYVHISSIVAFSSLLLWPDFIPTSLLTLSYLIGQHFSFVLQLCLFI